MVIQHLESLGFILNKKKSVLTPLQIQEYLGFTFNTRRMMVTVPDLKIKNLNQRLRQTHQPVKRLCRWIANLLGKMTAMLPAREKHCFTYDIYREIWQNHYPSIIKNQDTFIREEYPKSIFQPNQIKLGTIENRHLCQSTQPSTEKVLEFNVGPRSNSSGCIRKKNSQRRAYIVTLHGSWSRDYSIASR